MLIDIRVRRKLDGLDSWTTAKAKHVFKDVVDAHRFLSDEWQEVPKNLLLINPNRVKDANFYVRKREKTEYRRIFVNTSLYISEKEDTPFEGYWYYLKLIPEHLVKEFKLEGGNTLIAYEDWYGISFVQTIILDPGWIEITKDLHYANDIDTVETAIYKLSLFKLTNNTKVIIAYNKNECFDALIAKVRPSVITVDEAMENTIPWEVR